MNRFFTFKPNLFSGRFCFYFGEVSEWEKLRDWWEAVTGCKDHSRNIERTFTEADYGDWGALCLAPSHACPLIVLPSVPHTPQEIGYLVHEIHHAVQRWTSALGILTSDESEEVFAYVEGSLTEAVLDLLWHGNVQPGIEDVH